MRRIRHTTIALSILIAFSCATTGGASTPPPPESQTPNLCDIEGGRYCVDCSTSTSACRPGVQLSGWLCCDGGWCVGQAAGEECLGISGWCDDYREETTQAGSTYAVCED